MDYKVTMDNLEEAFNDIEDITDFQRWAGLSYYSSIIASLNGKDIIPVGVKKNEEFGLTLSIMFGKGVANKDGTLNLQELVTLDIIPNENTLECTIVNLVSTGITRTVLHEVLVADLIYHSNFVAGNSKGN